jgi:glycerol-3-phosphate O-acyltransferase
MGRQWELQRRLVSAESVSLELFKTAVRLARHRGLVDRGVPDLAKLRHDFAEEVRRAISRVQAIADMGRIKNSAR